MITMSKGAGRLNGVRIMGATVLLAIVACDGSDSEPSSPSVAPPVDAAPHDAGVRGGSVLEPGEGHALLPDSGADSGAADAKTPSSPLRVVVLSDLNDAYGSTTYETSVHEAVSAIVGTEKPDVVLISGDMVAGQKAGLDYPAMWGGFHSAVTSKLAAAGIPVAPAPGNHDASAYDAFKVEREEYERQWKPSRVPAVAMVDGTHFPFRYSFAVKDAFFVAIDATTIAPLSDEQRGWIEAQLDGASAYPMRIVYGHVPLHPTTKGRETEVLDDDELEAVLKKKGALFVGGHHHGYYPGVSGGVRHVVTPCIGSGPRALIGTSEPSARGFVVIDVDGGKVSSIEARTGAGYASNIARASLPASLSSGTHLLTRDDLAGF